MNKGMSGTQNLVHGQGKEELSWHQLLGCHSLLKKDHPAQTKMQMEMKVKS
jgi:hypothetical protein